MDHIQAIIDDCGDLNIPNLILLLLEYDSDSDNGTAQIRCISD